MSATQLAERISQARAAIEKAWSASDTRMMKENLAVALLTLDGEQITFDSLRARMQAMP